MSSCLLWANGAFIDLPHDGAHFKHKGPTVESRDPCRTTKLLRPNLPTLGRHGVGAIRLLPSPDLPYREDNPFTPSCPHWAYIVGVARISRSAHIRQD